ncbi:MAG: glycosyltransferase family 4 protein [Parcubacteria group bacterium]|nr:glycosyltransferase family 4 protein [Parcubacteria group bacterium]
MDKTKQKILYVITKGNFGGAQRYVYELATSMPKDKFDVVVAFGQSGALETKLKTAGVRTIMIPQLSRDVNLLGDIKTLFALTKIIRNERPDILHLNSSKVGALGGLAGRLTGVKKIIFTGHGWAFNEKRSFFSKTFILFSHWVTILLSHKTIAVSEKTKSQINKLPLVKNKIEVIHNGIGEIPFKEGFESRQFLGKNIREDLWIGTVSELHKNKGVDFIIEAFSQISSDFPNTTLVIIGEGEERDNLEQLVMEKNLQEKIHFVGNVDNARIYLKAFDIFTLTSRTEAFPYVILEAGLAGLPVVASAVGGIPEIIKNDQTGMLARVGDKKEINLLINDLLQNSEKKERLGKALGIRVKSDFSLQKMVEETIRVYNK